LKGVPKIDKDLIVYYRGEEKVITPATGKKKEKIEWVTVYDPINPMDLDKVIEPGIHSPICQQCGLFEHDCRTPFINYAGSKEPLVTILFDGVTRGEDAKGELASEGGPNTIKRIIEESENETGVSLADVRWVPMARCTNWLKKPVNIKTHANWCRYHAIQDLMRFPPALVIPVGTAALGLLSHKSNAQEWSGRLLTFRGWPDDWLMNPKYALPRVDPRDETKQITGHPFFGPIPRQRLPMVPLQSPRLIFLAQNPVVYTRWQNDLIRALKMARDGVKARRYTRDWYHFTDDLNTITWALNEILKHPGILICYDTETTGLRPWSKDAAIVSMMFRWTDPATNEPRSIGFPWDYGPDPKHPERADWEKSSIQSEIKKLKHLVWKVLTQSKIVGHNITFDMLYTFATFWKAHLSGWNDPDLNRRRDELLTVFADCCKYDTWHMAFAWQQKRGSLGLEVLAYDWVPDLAGYEEEMTILIGLHKERMDPAANKGGHYLNCPRTKWDSHVVPYVMGDVEVCHQARQKIQRKLQSSSVYCFPLADPKHVGKFHVFEPPDRNWVYHKIMSPAARVLMKMMARGFFVDKGILGEMETTMPKKIKQFREDLSKIDPRIQDWCNQKIETTKKKQEEDGSVEDWHLDLENKTELKELLFKILKLKVQRLTKQGRKLLGDDMADIRQRLGVAIQAEMPHLNDEQVADAIEEQLHEVAAVDKFTLNKLMVDHEFIRPLGDYRKLFKLYSTYVRPLRNLFTTGLDKKQRVSDQHLCFDSCIHASFMLTGTRGGRLSCRDPNLQQLPRDGEVKKLFVSRFGERGCVYQADLSQIELRLMAAACGDPTMVKAYFDDTDLHSLTASRIYGIPYDHFTKKHMEELQKTGHKDEAKQLDLNRTTAKTVNFLTGYGGGAFGLQNVLAMKSIYMKIEECQEIIERFFESYPALRDLLANYKRFILDYHVAVSIFGRVRVFEEVRGDDEEAKAKALRAGCNHLIQSTASDMMLTALVVIEELMRDAGLESMMVSTVHDSLVIDAVRTELPDIHDIVMQVLNNFPKVFKMRFGEAYNTSWMLVPFTGDAEVGLDYYSTNKIPKENIDWDKLLADEE
jgi:hypothetical protein